MSTGRFDRNEPLGAAVHTLQRAVATSNRIKHQSGLPQDVQVVANYVPLGLQAMESLHRDGKDFVRAKQCWDLANKLNQLLEFVESHRSSSDFLERYKQEAGDLGSWDKVMDRLLLDCIENGRFSPDLRGRLEKARKEIDDLSSSSKDKEKPATYTISNKDHGIQPVLTGSGNINFNQGPGQQFTGNNGTHHHHTPESSSRTGDPTRQNPTGGTYPAKDRHHSRRG